MFGGPWLKERMLCSEDSSGNGIYTASTVHDIVSNLEQEPPTIDLTLSTAGVIKDILLISFSLLCINPAER